MGKTLKLWAVVNAGMLAVVIVLLGVLIGQNVAEADRARAAFGYELCRDSLGVPSDENFEAYAECSANFMD